MKSPFLLAGAIGALAVHIVGMHWPFLQSILRTEPVSLGTWVVLLALSLTVFVAVEIHKWTWNLRYPPQ